MRLLVRGSAAAVHALPSLSASRAVSSGAGSRSATRCSRSEGDIGSGIEVPGWHAALSVLSPVASTGAVATLPDLLTSTLGVYGVSTSSASTPSESSSASVFV